MASSLRWPDAEFEADLRRLLRQSRKASQKALEPTEGESSVAVPVRPGRIMRFGSGALVLVDEDSMPLLRSLQRRITGSSRVGSGLSPGEAEALLIRACEEAVLGRVRDAVATLLATLNEEPVEYVVTEPVEILLPPDVPRLVVGRTTYSAKLPRLAIGPEFALKQRFVEPVATARVVSRGWGTARVLARQAFAESAAILDLVAPPSNTGSEATLARRRSDRAEAPMFTRRNWWFKAGTFSNGRLAPPYLHLSRAAARDEKRRSDWQRRVLGAVRWYSRGHRSESPADRVVSAMVALESLFIVGRQEPTKGPLIADRVTDRFRTRHLTDAEQREWLRRLYRHRNDAAHEGREVLDDLEVDSLLDLTLVVVRYGAFHLDPDHRDPRRACRTYAQAMRCHKPF